MNYFFNIKRIVIVDFDEFLIYENMKSIPLKKLIENFNTNFILTLMVDFYSKNHEDLNEKSFPETSNEILISTITLTSGLFKTHQFSRQNNMPVYTNLLRQRYQMNLTLIYLLAKRSYI